MMRALWTGASGMTSQQTNLDTIANNFSNVNTTGYKKESAQFATLLYQKIQTKTTDAQGNTKPVIGQVGLGVRNTAIVSHYSQGTLQESDSKWHMAIEGNGFFMVELEDGSTAYTRNGSFGLSIGNDGITLANADGYPVLDSEGEPIVFTKELVSSILGGNNEATDIDVSKISMDEYGNLMYPDASNVAKSIEIKVGLAQFNNPAGLKKLSGSLLAASDNSGDPRIEGEDTALTESKIHSKYLEASNVDTANEIVNLIVAQRAYEMNSKTITAADEMLQQANNLRR